MKRLFVGTFVVQWTESFENNVHLENYVDWFDNQHEAAGAMLDRTRQKHPRRSIASHMVTDITEAAKLGLTNGAFSATESQT